ncbi:intradiol ring-cleavage dioxygenase [Saccharothrix sp. Mg75]|uniref:intradiol ring-cleavage dioxygenase n=1 Tax=Saccharothrix sp. Mg75 TaxID=3445357 RepID=UPI003EF022EE
MSNDGVPSYEGRPLPRPDEEPVDQGLGFDLGTLLSRRLALRAFGLGAAALGLAACSGGSSGSSGTTATSGSTATSTAQLLQEIPDETAGPYPGDGSNGPDVLDRGEVVRGDIRTSFGGPTGRAEGVPMTLDLVVSDLAKGGEPFEGAAVYVWHCTREGGYSLYSEGIEQENYLRGVQVADSSGKVSFTSVFPACYAGRWPHVHFEVYPDLASIADVTKVIATSQVALPQDACEKVYAEKGYEASVDNLKKVTLDGDNVFGDDGGVTQLATVTGDVSGGFQVTLAVGVDTTTTPTGGGTRPGSDGQPSGAPQSGAPQSGAPQPSPPQSGAPQSGPPSSR